MAKWQKCRYFENKIQKRSKGVLQRKTAKYKNTLQRIQLTFIYFFAIVVLLYSLKNSLGFFPDILFRLFPFLDNLLNFQPLKILATPEKTFILYLVVLEIFINRSIFNFSLLVKFNVLLIFILEMMQNLLASYWDLLFTRELEIPLMNSNGGTVKTVTILFFYILFSSFFLLYSYSYIQAMKGLFPTFPGFLQKIVDSVAFWLQIKTPTMRFGNEEKNE